MASPVTSPSVAPTRPPAASPAIALEGVTRVFGVTPAVVRVDLAVGRGEAILLRGPNGAGKTTLLRILATAISPTYGRGSVLGFDLARDRDEIRRRTELLGHRTRLYEDLTAAENLRFVCRLYGLPPSRVGEALARTGLDGVDGERVRGFSQGMRQRLAVGRALLREPELLLLDEPYAGLDREARGVVDELIASARTGGGTVVLATHEPGHTELATRVVSMREGRVVEEVASR